MFETLRSIVHPWECDAVDHFTTAYYFRAFTSANRHLLQRLGRPGELAGLLPLSCHTRFARELRAGDPYHLMSGIIEADRQSIVLGHRLFNSETDALCATHRQKLGGECPPVDEGHRIEWQEENPVAEVDYQRLARWSRTALSVVGRDDLDPTGRLSLTALIHFTSDASVQFQNMIGMTSSYMREERIGFATMGYEIDLYSLSTTPGTALEVETALAHLGRSSLLFAHRAVDVRTGALVARVAQFGVHFDRVARRSAQVPAHIRMAAERIVGHRQRPAERSGE